MCALLLAGPALAKTKEIDPQAAYIVIDIENLDDFMIKGTDQPGTVTLGRYDPAKQDIRGGEVSPDTVLPGKQSPHLVIDRRPAVKSKAVRQYVVEIQPDTWVVEGANGTAFSLGSMQFEVKPGEVLDLGIVKPAVDRVVGEAPKSMGSAMLGAMFFGSTKPKNERPVRLDWRARTTGDLPLPALEGRTAVPVTFTPGAKFGNYLGGLVNRIGGRAQRVSDLSAEQNASIAGASEEAVSQ